WADPRPPQRQGRLMFRSFSSAALLALVAAVPAQAQAISSEKAEFTVETVADGLVHPWALALLPDGAMLVTERPGRLRAVSASGEVSEPIAGVPEVDARKQGGLLDV